MCAKARPVVTTGDVLARGSRAALALLLVVLSCAPSRPSGNSVALSGVARDTALAGSAEPGSSAEQPGKPAEQPGKPAQQPGSAASVHSLSGSVTLAREVVELKLLRALPIDRFDNFQPSGLLWHEGKLLTVSDKHETEVFELVVEEHAVMVRTYARFALPSGVAELDLEGLCSDGSGGLLLASEAQVRVLRIASDSKLSWATPSLDRLGASAGLFTLLNAKLEGIARLDDGRVILAAERSERGLLELPADGTLTGAAAWSMPLSVFQTPPGRAPDFSDLATSENELFALMRSAHLIVNLKRGATGWVEGDAWSFAQTENDDRFGYLDRRYGVAEGLALDGNLVYMVFDNNGNGRSRDPGDVRPQLLVFERPTR
jgi:hypothetical protein